MKYLFMLSLLGFIDIQKMFGMDILKKVPNNPTTWSSKVKFYNALAKKQRGKIFNTSDSLRRQGPVNDDGSMKLKFYRLMHEIVRDIDIKIDKAEQIGDMYATNTSFEIGYAIGHVTDQFNTMKEISETVRRLYDDWKPVEHVNAYETIANLGTEIGQLVDVIKSLDETTHH